MAATRERKSKRTNTIVKKIVIYNSSRSADEEIQSISSGDSLEEIERKEWKQTDEQNVIKVLCIKST